LVSFTPLPLYSPGKEPPVSIGQEAGWAPQPVWTLWTKGKSLAPVANRSPIFGQPAHGLVAVKGLRKFVLLRWKFELLKTTIEPKLGPSQILNNFVNEKYPEMFSCSARNFSNGIHEKLLIGRCELEAYSVHNSTSVSVNVSSNKLDYVKCSVTAMN
jgi:hypothetical protein